MWKYWVSGEIRALQKHVYYIKNSGKSAKIEVQNFTWVYKIKIGFIKDHRTVHGRGGICTEMWRIVGIERQS